MGSKRKRLEFESAMAGILRPDLFFLCGKASSFPAAASFCRLYIFPADPEFSAEPFSSLTYFHKIYWQSET